MFICPCIDSGKKKSEQKEKVKVEIEMVKQ
jgi:hypothetical protein